MEGNPILFIARGIQSLTVPTDLGKIGQKCCKASGHTNGHEEKRIHTRYQFHIDRVKLCRMNSCAEFYNLSHFKVYPNNHVVYSSLSQNRENYPLWKKLMIKREIIVLV